MIGQLNSALLGLKNRSNTLVFIISEVGMHAKCKAPAVYVCECATKLHFGLEGKRGGLFRSDHHSGP